MPATKFWPSTDLDAAIEWVAPAILALLADGVPRPKAAIMAALGGWHPKDEVTLTLMRLAVLGQLVETSGKHPLLAAEAEQG